MADTTQIANPFTLGEIARLKRSARIDLDVAKGRTREARKRVESCAATWGASHKFMKSPRAGLVSAETEQEECAVILGKLVMLETEMSK